MRNSAVLANVALAIRVAVVGGFLMLLPRITRKGLLFGAYVGEETTETEAARRLLDEWPYGCVLVIVLALAVGYSFSLAGWSMAGNFSSTVVLILAGVFLYTRFHLRAKKLVPPEAARQAEVAAASLQVRTRSTGAALAWFALFFCVVVSVGTFVYAIIETKTTALDGRLPFRVMFVPGISLWVSPFMAVLAVLAANAKRSLRGGSGGRSAEVQEAFRAAMTRVLSLIAIVICVVMTLMSFEAIRIQQDHLERPGLGFWLAAGFAFFFIIGSMLHIGRRFGQGGARRENGSVEAPLTNGLADNERWVFGLFYVNHEDPSIMVEGRFGLGYTFNYGNRIARLILGLFLAFGIVLITVGLIASSLGG